MSGVSDILIANVKEKGSEVTNFLEKEGIQIRFTSLRLVDYLIAGRVAVIRRTVDAFMEDLSNKMVYRTAPEFKRTFPDPLYIVEGDHPAAIVSGSTHGRSGVTYLTFVNKIPIIFSTTPEETAKYLAMMMKQAEFVSASDVPAVEIEDEANTIADGSSADGEAPVRILAAVPGITAENAKLLLEKFGSLRAVLDASESSLAKIKGIGAKKAKAIAEIFSVPASGNSTRRGGSSSKAPIAR